MITYLPNNYMSIIDANANGKKILVSNSYGSYNAESKNVPTNWISIK